MPTEIEVKYKATPEAIEALRKLPTIWGATGESNGVSRFFSIYFDTQSAELNRHKMALRIRSEDNKLIQTVKTPGAGSDETGIYVRGEWEWEISEPIPDLELLRETDIDSAVVDTMIEQGVDIAFTCEFTRERFHYGGSGLNIEVAIDDGCVELGALVGGHLKSGFREIEIELKPGSYGDFLEFLDGFKETIGSLEISTVSKAQRGYGLHKTLEDFSNEK